MKKAKKRNYRLFLLMLAVIVPSLVIGLVGVISISQQQRTRQLKLQERLSQDLYRFRREFEETIGRLIAVPFEQYAQAGIDVTNPESLHKNLHRILLKNPVIQYPFIIDVKGEYILPRSGISGQIEMEIKSKRGLSPKIAGLFKKGTDLEFKERNFTTAIRVYTDCLKKGISSVEIPYLYFAIGRCYKKMKKHPQALAFFTDCESRFGDRGENDKSLRFTLLREKAGSLAALGQKREALDVYLKLYEEILNDENINRSESTVFFKNEALDYLNQHIKDERWGEERFKEAKSADRLSQATSLDIALMWRFFDFDQFTESASAIDSPNVSKFLIMRAQDIPTDIKSVFYRAIRRLDFWADIKTNEMQIKNVRQSSTGELITIAFKRMQPPGNDGNPVFFGFSISDSFIETSVFPGADKRGIDSTGLKLLLVDQNQKAKISLYPLFSFSFAVVLPGKTLGLFAEQKNYFRQRAQKEILVNYGLIIALFFSLTAGIVLFYKYLRREIELVKMKAGFVDSASHTLKTPLTRIRMLTENIHLGWVKDENKKQEYLQAIVSEADRMADMINNMLDFSRIEAGKKEYEFKTGLIQEGVKKVIDLHLPYIKSQGFRFEIEIDDTIPSFSFDPEAIHLVVTNLVQNAVKYSLTEKEIFFKVMGEDDVVIIQIIDRGIGIEAKEFDHIFKKFYRCRDGRVKALQGSGLGLYLVKHAVEAHHGKIKVESKPGAGSIFTVSIPMQNIQEAANE